MEGVRILTTAANTNQNIIRKVPLFLDAIKFHESVFALPFAYIGMFLAADGFPGWHAFIWITIASFHCTIWHLSSTITNNKIFIQFIIKLIVLVQEGISEH